MTPTVKRIVVVAACLSFGAGSLALDASAKKKGRKGWVQKTADELQWKEVPNANGAKAVTLWGNPKRGAHGSMTKFPAGWEVSLHHHPSTLRCGIVAGTVLWTLPGGAPKELTPGSYAMLPGRMKHTTACKAGAECIIFCTSAGRFGVIMAKAKRKPKAEGKKEEKKAE